MIALNLAQNLALLVTLLVIYQLFVRWLGRTTLLQQLISGLLFGLVGVIAMMTPVHFREGVIFDGRSIMLGVAGLFGGPITASIAAIICGGYRLWLGGGGAIMGVSVISESALIGVGFYYLRRLHPQLINTVSLYIFSLTIHIIMVALMLTLPKSAQPDTFRYIAPWVITLYPIAMLVLCRVFIAHEEQHETRMALITSEERFRKTFEQAPIGMILADLNGCYLKVNNAFCNLVGYSADELLKMNFLEITHEKDKAQNIELLNKLKTGEIEKFTLEKRFIRKDGTAVCCRVSSSIIRDELSLALYLVGHIVDITQAKEHEKELEEREEFYRQVFTDVTAIRLLIDKESMKIVDANPAACKFYGYSIDELRGMEMCKINILPKDEVRAKAHSVSDSGGCFLFDHKLKNGEIKKVEVHTGPVNIKGKTLLHSIIFDVTDKLKAEAGYKALFESMLDGFSLHEVICNSNGNPIDYSFLSVNPAFEKLTGYKADYIIGKKATEVMPDIDPFWIEAYGRVALTGEPFHKEQYIAGIGRYLNITAYRPIPNQFACIFVDVTERKHAEDNMRVSEEKFSKAFRSAPVMITLSNLEDGRFVDVNNEFIRISGFSLDEAIGKTSVELGWLTKDDRMHLIQTVQTEGSKNIEMNVRTKDNRTLTCLCNAEVISLGEKKCVLTLANDITTRKLLDEERAGTVELFHFLNTPSSTQELLDGVAELIRKYSKCEAIGIRLREGDDYPYVVTLGFPADFVSQENHICTREENGNIVRDSNGNPILECTCGSVLSNKFDPTNPRYTKRGSFWMNSKDDIPASTLDKDNQENSRDRCLKEGFQSIALIPLRIADKTLGLIQINDVRPDRFTKERIGFLERLSDSLAIALSQRLASAALIESEQRLMAAHELARLGSYIFDIHTGKWSSSDILDRIFGIDDSFVRSKDGWLSIIHQDWLHTVEDYFTETVLSKSDKFDQEYKIVSVCDGEERWVHGLGELVFDKKNKISKLSGTIQDITERKQTEEALRESESRLRAIANSAKEAIVTADKEGIIVGWNQSATVMFGIPEEQAIGSPITSIMPEKYRAQHPESISRVASGGDKHVLGRVLELEGYKNDGSTFPVELSLAEWESGGQIFFTAIIRDISARKRAESELLATETRYRRLFEAARDGILILDADNGSIIDVNPFLIELLGYTREEFLGKKIWELGFLKDIATSKDNFKALQENEYIRYDNLPLETSDGRKLEVEFISNLYQVGDRNVFQCNIRDITERKHAEEEKRILEEKLSQSQRLEAVGQLAGGIAHDFNNLLTGILGYCDLLRPAVENDKEASEDLQQIYDASQRAAELTSRLLAFGRKQLINPRNLDLNLVISNISRLLSRVIGETIKLDVIPGHKLGTVYADPGQIEQVIMNLAVNARDAMPNGGRLTIETENVVVNGEYVKLHPWATAGRYMLISFTDTGAGISKENIDRIFDPFFTTKESGKGTGLGLSTVYGIIKQHNGMINVYSEIGKGTIFKIYLPIVERPAENVEVIIESKILGGTETILLAEDDEIVLELAVRVIKKAGYNVIVAHNGLEAVNIFRECKDAIDLILLDLVMPELGGLDAYQRIIQIDPNKRFLFCSGYSPESTPLGKVSLTGIPVVKKPYNPDELLRAIRKILDEKKTEALS